jgi:hypothetical protein
MGDYGIKISQPGYDITNTAIQYQVFNSTANSLKVWMSGIAQISMSAYGSGGGYTGQTTIAHGLGYQPFFLCYFGLYTYGGPLYMQDSLDDAQLFSNYIYGTARVDTVNFIPSIVASGSGTSAWTGQCYYYIFIDKALI